MAKDYAKFVPPKPRSPKKKKSGNKDYFFVIFFILFGAMAIGLFLLEKEPQVLGKILAAAHPKKNLIAVAQAAPKSKPHPTAVAENKTPVQFDFYSALPSMQVTVSNADATQTATAAQVAKQAQLAQVQLAQAQAATQEGAVSSTPDDTIPAGFPKARELVKMTASMPSPVNAAPDPRAAMLADPNGTADAEATPAAQIASAAPSPIFTPSEVNNLLAADAAPSQNYFVQVGSFDTADAANRMLSAMTDVGFTAQIVKQNQSGHTIYRVEQGPFESMALAKTGQQQLLKRGITSFIRKTTLS
jgi:cell division protein FtsN